MSSDNNSTCSEPTTHHVSNRLNWVGTILEVHPSDIPVKINEIQTRLHRQLVRQWRQHITGDPERRIRDNMDDHQVQTKLKQVDAFSFAFGVVLTLLMEYIILAKPQYFPWAFYCLMPPLIFHRFFAYQKEKSQFFLIDFCYFMQLSTIINTLVCPNEKYSEECEIWFKTNYVLSHGPIAFAIIAWQNSLVFHSLDKVTSFALHIMPCLTYYLLRWDERMIQAGLATQLKSLSWTEQFYYPLCFYLSWQLFYFYVQFTVIEKDKELVTSLRHLANDHKNPSTKMGTKLAIKMGFIKRGEMLDPYKPSIIMMFALFQLFYMIGCLIPTFLLFRYEFVNAIYLIFVTFWAVLNGGSYYIQIFSQRYNTKFLAKTQIQPNNDQDNHINDKSD